MIYPDERLVESVPDANTAKIDTMDMVGSGGLNRLMTFTESVSPPGRYGFEYKPSKSNIIKSKIKIDTIGKNKVTLKKIIGTNNKIRIFSYKYTGSKINK